jgi:hypothetical protein
MRIVFVGFGQLNSVSAKRNEVSTGGELKAAKMKA